MSVKESETHNLVPIVPAAGKPYKFSESVGDIFKEYPKEEFAEKLVKQNNHILRTSIDRIPPIIPEANRLKDILGPDSSKSRFLEFKDQFYEKLYCKKVPLGKSTPTNSKPDNVTNDSVTFGKVSEKSERVYELALPNRSNGEVMKEFVKWHDKYKISHGSYFPSEQKNRRYNKNFNRNQVFGKIIKFDMSGTQVKRILQESPYTSKMFIISKVQEENIQRHKSLVGQPIRRPNIVLPQSTTFGVATTPGEYNVAKLLRTSVEPEEISKYANDTTYRSFANELQNSNAVYRSPAGKIESPYPRKGDCRFFAENLGEETTVKQLISPTIPTHFGLSHRDFFLPRSKDKIKEIFTKAGWDLGDDENFEKVWSLASSQWASTGGGVSIEAFKFALQTIKTNVQ
ncbi:EF-hand domain-containing family member B-like [Eupeodes corollae]|uniref:EF-hand domain-containing family member B-like n=1 Tax=Eupeodes corollae TaxID=290404 RepID=UPI002493C6C4|nr:EF-hand domain-containing family member B-like [Eupeodes corollae]